MGEQRRQGQAGERGFSILVILILLGIVAAVMASIITGLLGTVPDQVGMVITPLIEGLS